jgi:hypothetical protein
LATARWEIKYGWGMVSCRKNQHKLPYNTPIGNYELVGIRPIDCRREIDHFFGPSEFREYFKIRSPLLNSETELKLGIMNLKNIWMSSIAERR